MAVAASYSTGHEVVEPLSNWSKNKSWPQRMRENFCVTLEDVRVVYFHSKTSPFLTNAGEAWEGCMEERAWNWRVVRHEGSEVERTENYCDWFQGPAEAWRHSWPWKCLLSEPRHKSMNEWGESRLICLYMQTGQIPRMPRPWARPPGNRTSCSQSLREGQDVASLCCPSLQARGLPPPSSWENALGTKQPMEKGQHKRHHVLSKGLTELTYEFSCSLIHSFIHQMCIRHLLSARHWTRAVTVTDKVPEPYY